MRENQNLTFAQLLVQLGNVIIPLSLEKVAGDGISKSVFLCKGSNLEITTSVSWSIGEHFLISIQRTWLLVYQVHVSMETCSFWWSGTNILRQDFSISDTIFRDVYHEPVVPFPISRVLSWWSIGIRFTQGVKCSWFCRPWYSYGWILDLSGS